MKLTIDMLKLDFAEVYKLHYALQCTGKETTLETLQHIEYLAALPMSAKEAKNIIPIIKENMAELSMMYEDEDFYDPEEKIIYYQEQESYNKIIQELVRIANLEP